MYCDKCGSFLEEGVKFCPNCGAQVAAPAVVKEAVVAEEPAQPVYEQPEAPVYEQPEAPVYEQPVYQQPETPAYQQPVVQADPAVEAQSTPILIFGIIGIALAVIPYINFLGIIFSAIAKSKVKKYLADGGVLTGKAKVGNILATVGLILGIVFTVFWTIVISLMIFGVVSNAGSSNIRW